MKGLEGKVALVTGGSSGIGRAAAIVFAREGAKVVIGDVGEEGGDETVTMIKETGGEAMFVKTDVSKADQVKTLIDETIKTHGRLDIAFNNAGVEQVVSTLPDCTEEEWDRVININLKGVWLCLKYEIPVMLNQGKGAIVNTSSVGGLIGGEYNTAYIAAKHGVVGITKSAALEYAAAGIRVNAVCPGMTRTPLVDALTGGNEELENLIIGMHPIGRMAEPMEIAEAAVWLCSDEASFVTGHALSVDGGWVAQ
ncbi:MAG: SDR family oxidoreductase [Chloroflexi bacterium]|nr:SDR family oxidoreductase [Chloroflexota bacterium]